MYDALTTRYTFACHKQRSSMLYGRTRDGVTFYRRQRSKASSDCLAMVDPSQLTGVLGPCPRTLCIVRVASVSKGLLAAARFSDHVAVLTGRYAAEHLKVAALRPVATDRN